MSHMYKSKAFGQFAQRCDFHTRFSGIHVQSNVIPTGGRFATMAAGNYISDFVSFVFFWKMQPCSLNPPPSKHRGGYGAFYSRSMIAWSDVLRSIARNSDKTWNVAFDINLWSQFRRENSATRTFNMRMSCTYGPVVKLFQVILYQPGAFCNNDGR